MFEATTGHGNEGDIALDDVDLITGKCDLLIDKSKSILYFDFHVTHIVLCLLQQISYELVTYCTMFCRIEAL
jgi:hypothetical protein